MRLSPLMISLASLTGSFSLAIKRLEKMNAGGISTGSTSTNLVMPSSFERMQRRERKELASTFERVSEVTAEELQRLVNQTEAVLALLNRLDSSQNTLHRMIVSEETNLRKEHAKKVSLHVYLATPTCYSLRLALYLVYRIDRGFLFSRIVRQWICLPRISSSWSRWVIPETSLEIALRTYSIICIDCQRIYLIFGIRLRNLFLLAEMMLYPSRLTWKV